MSITTLLIAVLGSSMIVGCGASTKGPAEVIRHQGYWPLISPDDGLLPPGTIAVISRDNPVEFHIVCAASAWGVEATPVTKSGLSSLDDNSKFEISLNAQASAKLSADVQAKYKNDRLVNVGAIQLTEIPTSDARMTGTHATHDCQCEVLRQQQKKLKVSSVLGSFRATIKYSSAVEASGDATVKAVVAASLNVKSQESLTGEGVGLVWGIKYENLPDIKPSQSCERE